MADQGDDVIDHVSAAPPRWAEYALRLVLHPRDRDPITGDLLEEYREVALPALGPARAGLWYLKQVGSIMTSSNTSIPSPVFVGVGVVLLGALAFIMVRSDFGPPSHEIISFGGVAAIAIVLGVSGATVLRSALDLERLWRVSRLWGLVLGASLIVGTALRIMAPSFLLEDGPLPHPGHIPGVSAVAMRLYVVAIVGIFMAAGFRGAWRTRQVRQGILAAVATAVIGAVIALIGGTAANIAFAPAGSGLSLEGGPIPVAALLVAPMLSTFPGTIGAMFGRGFVGRVLLHPPA